jgi:YidC/Oxa1 family membrane protein insertase
MNDIRRTILMVVFTMSLVFLWDGWMRHNGKAGFFSPPPKPVATETATPSADRQPAAPAGTPSAAPVPSASGAASVPSSGANPAAPAGAAASTATPKGELVTVKTDVMTIRFDTTGGDIQQVILPRFSDQVDASKPVTLLDQSKERVYLAQTGLVGGSFPTHKTVMTLADGPRALAEGQNELSVRFESPEVGGLKYIKTYTLQRGSYVLAVKHEVRNVGSQPANPSLYLQIVRDGNKPAGESSWYFTFTGPAQYTDAKKFHKIEFSDIEKNKVELEKTADNGWVAMVQHYFATAWLLPQGTPREFFTRKVDTNLYSVGMIAPLQSLAPGASKTLDTQLFIGPQEEKKLEALTPGLELVKDYGWVTILAKPLYWLMEKLHAYIGNWGWTIVALVVLLKIAFYWLNASAYRSMAKMKKLTPRLTEMRERYKDKPQDMQRAMMELYKTEKVNPLGGCFPIAIQIPVFIALYWVLLSSVEIRNAPWLGWITDLASPDPYFVLPVVMTLTTLLQTWLNPTPPDPVQARLMWIMPMVFSVFFFFFPAGLVLYWLTNNVLSIAQQYLINRQLGVHK